METAYACVDPCVFDPQYFIIYFALIIFLVIIIISEGKYEISVVVFNGIETEYLHCHSWRLAQLKYFMGGCNEY
jgi:hypothetical protein